jgi:hypothetical protein
MSETVLEEAKKEVLIDEDKGTWERVIDVPQQGGDIVLDDVPELSTCNPFFKEWCVRVSQKSGLLDDTVCSIWNIVVNPLPCTYIIKVGSRKGLVCGADCHPQYSNPAICPKHVASFLKKAPAQGSYIRASKSTVRDLYIYRKENLYLVLHQPTRGVVGKIEDSTLVTSLTEDELKTVSELKLSHIKMDSVTDGMLIQPYIFSLNMTTKNQEFEQKEIELCD